MTWQQEPNQSKRYYGIYGYAKSYIYMIPLLSREAENIVKSCEIMPINNMFFAGFVCILLWFLSSCFPPLLNK